MCKWAMCINGQQYDKHHRFQADSKTEELQITQLSNVLLAKSIDVLPFYDLIPESKGCRELEPHNYLYMQSKLCLTTKALPSCL